MALRRENDNLKSELQRLQDYVNQLSSKPETNETDALICLAELPDPQLTPDDLSTMLTQKQYSMADYQLKQPLPFVRSTQLAFNAQAGLPLNYPKAYPQILAFENPNSVARDLLGPSTPSRLDGILR